MEPVVDTMPIGELLDERRHLLDVAHWMLGSGLVAEHVTDEAYREWYALSEHQRDRIGAPRAWLTRVVGSISLARLALSEGDGGPRGPVDAASRGGSDPALEDALGALWAGALDALTPAERAALVLNDAFGGAVAEPVTTARPADRGRRGPADVEPLDRARHSLRARAARPTTPRVEDELVDAVRQACADEDADRLAALLDPDAVAFYDGGGKVRTLTRPVVGGPRVARSLLTLLARHPRTTLHTRPVNGRTGLVARYDGQVAAVVSLDLAGTRVVQVWVVLNPDKLRSWNRPRA
ncbi:MULTISPECIES: sigma-70 family RNA polymerase sigma factor family protein [Streptomyces]|uniref:RNA polymerase subunit sigma n=1 Tax=Streptomyces tendae TaxID=1932 RepID=A0ABW7SDC8_STRTE|nr:MULTISPECIES: RNA polymerase subunit sigma [unclassified Streptomyces]MBQ0966655.1 RNA polymerase subunit sigma [Streptomyces sp. RK74B]MBQ1007062.1 RNA polymerase subunit sigma [Streptomyces sp. RK23]